VTAGDFFLVPPTGSYDAVIGNPPYVRYQDFAGEARARSREAALRAGVPLTRLASSWAAFTVHGALFLKPGGRLGLVLPAELLSVNYAAEVRRFLMQRFARIRLCCSLNGSFRACRRKSFCCSPTVTAKGRPTTANSSSSVPLQTWRERLR
jgi:type I restriction-modification system DNA methylase subunit